MCGDINKTVKSVYLTLDTNINTVNEAADHNADMIISHHPIMLGGLRKADYNTPSGYILKKLISNDIALYAAHTNLDCAKGGVNDALAEKLGITGLQIIEKNEALPCHGLGRIGNIKGNPTLGEFALKVKKALDTPFVRVCGDTERVIKTVAVGSGACDDLIPAAASMGADVMVTADMKYHTSIDSVESGICVIDAGHYPTERMVVDIFEKLLTGCELDIIKSTNKDIFQFI